MGIKAYFINLKFMKTFKFLITLIFLTTSILGAQEKKYTSYIVKEGETIKSIAKEFDISEILPKYVSYYKQIIEQTLAQV